MSEVVTRFIIIFPVAFQGKVYLPVPVTDPINNVVQPINNNNDHENGLQQSTTEEQQLSTLTSYILPISYIREKSLSIKNHWITRWIARQIKFCEIEYVSNLSIQPHRTFYFSHTELNCVIKRPRQNGGQRNNIYTYIQ